MCIFSTRRKVKGGEGDKEGETEHYGAEFNVGFEIMGANVFLMFHSGSIQGQRLTVAYYLN